MKRVLLIIMFMLALFQGFSQTKGISYQAVILSPTAQELPGENAEGNILANSAVSIQFTVVNATGNEEYQEKHSTRTDRYGMINLLIGTGSSTGSNDFADIVWNGTTKKLKVGIDFSGNGNNFVALNEQLLTYMPQPVSTATQSTLDLKAPLASPAFTGTVTAPTFVGALAGNAGTATALATSRTINGVAFDGTADITITAVADANTLTGTTLAPNVLASSLTSVGTLGSLTVIAPITGSITGNAATATTATNVSGTVAVANGGTGASSLTANTVLLGNGTSALQVVAPGTNGQVLTLASGIPAWAAASGGGGSGWSLTGNAGTTDGTNFIGTTDAQDLVFKTNATETMRILSDGNVGIGTITPGATLEVAGQVKITGGTPGAGKILTSDANGLASWTTIGAPRYASSMVLQDSSTSTTDSEIYLPGLGFRWNQTTKKLEIKGEANNNPQALIFYFSYHTNSSSTINFRPDTTSSNSNSWTAVDDSWSNTLPLITGYYAVYDFDFTVYPINQGGPEYGKTYSVKILLDGWGGVHMRVTYY